MSAAGTVTAFVAVGSNIDPARHVPAALDALVRLVPVTGSSTFYRTAPEARPGQPPFANGVWRLETGIAPRPLKFEVLRAVEDQLGRVRGSDPHAARPIDLDLLLHGEAQIDEPDLAIPAPEIAARPYVAGPLWELAPNLRLPGGAPLATLVTELDIENLEPWSEITDSLQRRLAR